MRRAFLTLTIALAACSGRAPVAPQVSAVLDETFALRVGQEVLIGDEPLRLVLEAVTEDSRCPSSVVCVWQGNGRIRLRATATAGGPRAIELNTTVTPRAATVFAYDVALERLEPEPVVDNRIPQNRYIAYLKVTRP